MTDSMDSMETDPRDAAGDETKLRTFVALALAKEARSAAARASALLQREPWAKGVRWVPAENLHLTLRFLGPTEVASVAGLIEALAARLRSVESFGCELRGVALFPTPARPRVIAIQVSEEDALANLAGAVEEAVVAAGVSPETRRFRAHITLARFRGKDRRGIKLTGEPEATPVPVSEVVLYQSTLGQGKARYDVLGRAALGARGRP